MDDHPFDEEHDAGHRPTYGVMFVNLRGSDLLPSLLLLSYGRRANRLLRPVDPLHSKYEDRAAEMHIDGDADRDGRYPDWLEELAKTDKRFSQDDEKPFRSHGNNFDAAVGDINGDGLFDLFITDITHAWAGKSADRSRFYTQLNQPDGEVDFRFEGWRSVDRPEVGEPTTLPASHPGTQPSHPNWNQGDLFAQLADLDHDGRLDLILCSSDYPDPPPHENRLRIFHQESDGSFADVTAASGIDLLGAQQPTLADLDSDGDLDLLVGQSFNRFTKPMIDARTPPGPVAHVYLNQTAELRHAAGLKPNALTVHLVGDPQNKTTRSAFNAIVAIQTRDADGTTHMQYRQLFGPGGHNGKAGDCVIHFGLGEASEADSVTVRWPSAGGLNQVSKLGLQQPGDITIYQTPQSNRDH